MDDTLQIELAAYRAQLKSFYKHEGRYVVLKGEQPLGFYPSYEAALDAGYENYGLDPFMVKKVCMDEQPVFVPECGDSQAEH